MKSEIFREKSLKRVSSPEQLNDYIRVSSLGIWIILIAVILLLIGGGAFCLFGRLDTTVKGAAVIENSEMRFILDDMNELSMIKEGQVVYIYNKGNDEKFESVIKSVTDEGVFIDADKMEVTPSESTIYKVEVVVESVAPISFFTN